ncbi:MAG: GNAT family N-acetyltransferase [Candidatus Dormibacteraeota bacterium]|nr:GNAT family N-acetyltransferase [Candidatus Dormibacteraeota bacterium]
MLRTDRLVVRIATEEDVPGLLRFFTENREHMAPWEPPRPADFLTEEFWRVQVGRHRRAFENGAAVMLFMFLRDEPHRVVGQISLTSIVRGPADMCVIGYALSHDVQGQGYMHEGLQATISYAFSELNLHRIMANFMPHNVRSNAVLRRLGFAVEGYARDYLFIGGSWRDHVLTALTNPNWKASD